MNRDESRKWQPVIQGEAAAPYAERLAHIAQDLVKYKDRFKSIDGFDGDRIGVLLFFFYYSRYGGGEPFTDHGFEMLADLFDDVNERMESSNFTEGASGLAGIGWVMEHLAQNGFLEMETQEILEAVDPLIGNLMNLDVEKENFELICGALTKGLFFLNRLYVPDSGVTLARMVELTAEKLENAPAGGLRIQQTLKDENMREVYVTNLGMTNGLSGMACYLSRLYEQGIAPQQTRALINGLTTCILSHEQDPEKHLSYFPAWVVGDSSPSESRLAWCYGDLGMAMGLWQIAAITADKELEQKALQIGSVTTRRRDLKRNAVQDAGMCHGTAGNGHLYNRLYHYTGKPEFKEAALYWFEETLKMATFEDGYGRFKSWKGRKMGGWHNLADIVDGVSGIGLALLAALSDIEPKWDRMFLLS